MTIDDIKNQGLILFEAIAGSKSFGLDTSSSDTDIKGVFYLPKDKFYGLEYIPQVSNETNDIVYYELGRFVDLLLKNNPNILELLATPDEFVIYKHPLMQRLKIEDFLSRLCKDTFGGYATTQIKKAQGLKKKIVNPVAKERKSLLSFCYILNGYESVPLHKWLTNNNFTQEQCGLVNIPHFKGTYGLYYDHENTLGYKGVLQKEISNEVSLSSVPEEEKVVAYMSFNSEGYSSYCREYKEYWEWIDKRNEDRYNTNQQHAKNYDSKNMMHTIRLLQSAKQIFAVGRLNIKVTNRQELLNIKMGKKNYDELLEMADKLLQSINKHYETSSLPPFPDSDKAEKNLINIRKELYQ